MTIRPTERIKEFARQMSDRATGVEDHALANTLLSLAAAVECMGIAIRDLYDQMSRINKKLDRGKSRGPTGG